MNPPRALAALPWLDRLRPVLRLLHTLWLDVAQGGLDLWATSLVYTTLLSLAPLLAVSFSVLQAFGVHNQMRPLLLEMLDPLGDAQAAEVADRIIGFVNNLDVGVLGFAGFALLFYTVLSLLQKIEDCFNRIWRVDKPRGFRRRFSEYLSVLLVGPVLVFSALGLMASMTSHRVVQTLIAQEPFGTLYYLLGQTLPSLFMIAACTFFYVFIPNTRVRLGAALAGGAAAGLSWRLAGWLFGVFVAGSAQYQAIYSSFAILVMFMIWLYVSWLILLLGVDIAYHVQHPADLGLGQPAGRAALRRTGLAAMGLVGQRFLRGEPPLNPDELAGHLGLPGREIQAALEALRRRGLVLEVEQDSGAYLPTRDLGALPLREILDALDGTEAIAEGPTTAPEALLRRLREAERNALEGMSLRQWLEAANVDGSRM